MHCLGGHIKLHYKCIFAIHKRKEREGGSHSHFYLKKQRVVWIHTHFPISCWGLKCKCYKIKLLLLWICHEALKIVDSTDYQLFRQFSYEFISNPFYIFHRDVNPFQLLFPACGHIVSHIVIISYHFIFLQSCSMIVILIWVHRRKRGFLNKVNKVFSSFSFKFLSRAEHV